MQLIRLRPLLILLLGSLFIAASTQAQRRIVSLNGTVTEVVCALGFEKSLVGVDVTSTYPASVQKLPKVGHNRNISAEPVLALQPDLILATSNFLAPAVIGQFNATGVKTVVLQQEYSVEGTKKLIREIAAALQATEKGATLCKQLDQQQRALKVIPQAKKVLFIYARGAGTMMVAGQETPLDKIITLAGAKNAASGFKDFKPLTTEALVAANPDVILLFDSGLESVGGVTGLLKVPGVQQTTAGKQQKIIAMDGQFLSGFGPRVLEAVKVLSEKLKA
ncbi:iron complex transport system substrate-binding protein [Chitinophaga rupis]|uniref:Iron complex transport system substrate-binding protein n=1 Tax=Chitinophaga rupis TaxID=573321 RepID=A0A1H7H9H5_9BACT|nr:helical backbone metal receptor [Chitinophaga rupis]SEK45690.1 iron complex transport system substrate-binding protein [Chitinophaga rupis]